MSPPLSLFGSHHGDVGEHDNMSTTNDSNDSTDLPPDAPEGWHWGLGNRSSSYYTHWLYTNRTLYPDEDSEGHKFGWEAEIYWDKGGGHNVVFYPITKMKDNGDLEYGYPHFTKSFESEQEALAYALQRAKEIR